MEKRTYDISANLTTLLNQYNVLFFDIETDGLSHKNKVAIIGLVHIPKLSKSATVIQLFNDDFGSEKEILQYFVEFLKTNDIDYLISFNGHAFDIPFLNARLEYHHIHYTINKGLNIDLLRIAKKNMGQLKLSDYKLKTIEAHLGIHREDVISGRESVLMYQAYIETHSRQLKEAILLHNYDDILNMIPLVQILDESPGSIPPSKAIHAIKWYLIDYKIKSNQLICILTPQNRYRIEEIHYETQFLRFQCNALHAELKIDLTVLKDAQNNRIQIMDTQKIYNKPFDLLSNEDKFEHTICYNQHIYEAHLIKQVFSVLEHLLDKIVY